MKYAEVYNIQKEVPLTKKSINKVIQSLNNGVSSYGYLLFEISAATKVIGKLADLLNNKSYTPYLDEDGNFLLVAKIQNGDKYGNSRSICFYTKDKVSNVPEVEINERLTITEDQLEDIKRKRVEYIDVLSIFSMIEPLERDYRKPYKDFVDAICNIKTDNDIFALLEKANEYYTRLNQKYNELYSIAMNMTKKLQTCKSLIEEGKNVTIILREKVIIKVEGEEFEKFEYGKLFNILEFFSCVGTSSLDSFVTISTLKEFETLISLFDTMGKNRSADIENLLINKYQYLLSNNIEKFELCIGGGY